MPGPARSALPPTVESALLRRTAGPADNEGMTRSTRPGSVRFRIAAGWRATKFLLRGLPTALAALLILPLLGVGVLLRTSDDGFGWSSRAAARVRRLAGREQRRASAYLDGPTLPHPSTVSTRTRGGPTARQGFRWLSLHALVGTGCGLLGVATVAAVPLFVYTVASWWLDPFWVEPTVYLAGLPLQSPPVLLFSFALAGVFWATGLVNSPTLAAEQARLYRRLLSLSPAEQKAAELAERVAVLTETRSEALDAHGAELRRIERDLHDGAQARLVSLAMRLGVAERTLAEDPENAVRLLREARTGAEEAMTELRDVVRTIYPPILADRGLSGAVSALAARCVVPTKVTVEELGPVPAPVEAAAYFVVAEALTNAAKHSAATQVLVGLSRSTRGLRVEILDDGVGGVDESLGTGIAGIRRRVAALDGTTTILAPTGGPTSIDVELPCE